MLSSLLTRFNEPETLKMAKLGRELRAQGVDVVDLSLGEPDFDTPEFVKQAAIEAINANFSHYPPVAGYLDLREAICEKLLQENGLHYKPTEVMVSNGAKQCIANLVLALVDAGDEVIIPTPYWVTYSEIVKLAGGIPKMVDCPAHAGFKLSGQVLRNEISGATKLLMFSSPCNPTGAFYSREELAELQQVLLDFPNCYVMSDEIYEYINFGAAHESIAALPGMKDRTLVINGLSKGFAMTGYRLGYVAGPEAVIKACEKIQGQFTSGVNAVTQRAAIPAIKAGRQAASAMLDAFAQRRQLMMEELKTIPYFQCTEPEAAFYIFPEVSACFGKNVNGQTIANADDLCMYLLNTAHVSSVTGRAFGNDRHIRISFANSEANLREGMKRIRQAMQSLQ